MRIEGGASWRYAPRTIKKLMGNFNKAHNISNGYIKSCHKFLVSIYLYLFVSYFPISLFGSIHDNPGFVPIHVKFENRKG